MKTLFKHLIIEASTAPENDDLEAQVNKDFVLMAVRHRGHFLMHANQKFKDDKDVVLAAVKQNPHALQYASDRLKRDFDVLIAAGLRDLKALYWAKKDFVNSPEFIDVFIDELYAHNFGDVVKEDYLTDEPLDNDLPLAPCYPAQTEDDSNHEDEEKVFGLLKTLEDDESNSYHLIMKLTDKQFRKAQGFFTFLNDLCSDRLTPSS